MWGSGDMSSLSKSELIDLDTAWRRREARVPARFGTHLAYLAAVENGLLTTEPQTSGPVPDLQAMQTAIRAMLSEEMPPWQPRPEGPSKHNLIALCGNEDEME